MSYPIGYLKQHPIAPDVAAPLRLDGYQLLVEAAGIGVGKLNANAFLVVAPEPDAVPEGQEPASEVVLHQSRLRNDKELATFLLLAGELSYLRLSGYRMVLEGSSLRASLYVVAPSTGGAVLVIPDKHPAGLFGGGARSAPGMLAIARALPEAGSPPALDRPELLQQALLTLALKDKSLDVAGAAGVAARAAQLLKLNPELDSAAALAAARQLAS